MAPDTTERSTFSGRPEASGPRVDRTGPGLAALRISPALTAMIVDELPATDHGMATAERVVVIRRGRTSGERIPRSEKQKRIVRSNG